MSAENQSVWYGFNHNEVLLGKYDTMEEADKDVSEYRNATCNPGYIKNADNLSKYEQESVDRYEQNHR